MTNKYLAETNERSERTNADPPCAVVLDVDAAMVRVDNDHALYRRCVAIFDADVEGLRVALEQSLVEQCHERSQYHAHRLKGYFATIGAEECCSIIQQMEDCFPSQSCARMSELLRELNDACCRLDQALALWRPLGSPDASRRLCS